MAWPPAWNCASGISRVVAKELVTRNTLISTAAVVSIRRVPRIRPVGCASVSPGSPETWGITATPEQLLALVKPIKSPHLGVNIDTGNFHTADPYADVAKIAPYGVVCQINARLGPTGESNRFIRGAA